MRNANGFSKAIWRLFHHCIHDRRIHDNGVCPDVGHVKAGTKGSLERVS